MCPGAFMLWGETMEIHTTISALREAIRRRAAAKTVLVPTMGALHDGHRTLIEEGRDLADEDGLLVVSIFVNPTQFGVDEDYEDYPRRPEEDAALCKEAGVDLLFFPSVGELYAGDASVRVTENKISEVLCGRSRPGHFSGVCTIVSQLFNIVRPDTAVFGKKDRQQLAILQRMVRDLKFPVEIVGVETVREDDGLALSSRNRYLEPEQRAEAPRLHYGLELASRAFFEGERRSAELIKIVQDTLHPCHFARIDYVDVVDAESMQSVALVDRDVVLAAAVFFGDTRLIDNVELVADDCFDQSPDEN